LVLCERIVIGNIFSGLGRHFWFRRENIHVGEWVLWLGGLGERIFRSAERNRTGNAAFSLGERVFSLR
jgi:hypothetical protein